MVSTAERVTHRRSRFLRSRPQLRHSRRLLILSRLARLSLLDQSTRRFYSLRGGRDARPPPPVPRGLTEVEAMFYAGFRSIRAWRKARKHGGFPEPARVTPQGPLWTASQIAEWLGVQWPDLARAPDYEQDDAVTPDETALLAKIDRLELTA